MQVLWIVAARFLPRGCWLGEAILPSRGSLRGSRAVQAEPLIEIEVHAVGKDVMEVVMNEQRNAEEPTGSDDTVASNSPATEEARNAPAWPRDDPEVRGRFTAAMVELTGWAPDEDRLNSAVEEMLDKASSARSQFELKAGIAEIVTRHAVSWPRIDDRVEIMVKDIKMQWPRPDPYNQPGEKA